MPFSHFTDTPNFFIASIVIFTYPDDSREVVSFILHPGQKGKAKRSPDRYCELIFPLISKVPEGKTGLIIFMGIVCEEKTAPCFSRHEQRSEKGLSGSFPAPVRVIPFLHNTETKGRINRAVEPLSPQKSSVFCDKAEAIYFVFTGRIISILPLSAVISAPRFLKQEIVASISFDTEGVIFIIHGLSERQAQKISL